MTQKISLKQYIEELPMDESVKQEWLGQLAQGEEEAVKVRLVETLRQAGLTLSVVGALEKVDADFQTELADIEGQAKNLIKAVSEESDKLELEELRQTLS